jgi:hypothetical protein
MRKESEVFRGKAEGFPEIKKGAGKPYGFAARGRAGVARSPLTRPAPAEKRRQRAEEFKFEILQKIHSFGAVSDTAGGRAAGTAKFRKSRARLKPCPDRCTTQQFAALWLVSVNRLVPVGLMAHVIIVGQVGDDQAPDMERIDRALVLVKHAAIGIDEYCIRHRTLPCRIECSH